MQDLNEIQDFIQKVSETVAHSLEIECLVVGVDLRIIAGTLNSEFSIANDGVIKRVIETGQWYIVEHPVKDASCSNCTEKQKCKEKAFIHCPIFFNNKVVGVMGLICFNDIQREKLIKKKYSFLPFIQNMCELICLKMNEHEMYKKAQHHNTLLNQILNTVSDGYVIINTDNQITNINNQALKILATTQERVINKMITEVIPDLDIKNVLGSRDFTCYDEITLGGKTCGVIITAMKDNGNRVGAVISFKKVDKITNRVYSRAFQTMEITFDDILGKSNKMLQVKELAKTVASNNANVLLLGESGTGKELFARAIHTESERSSRPFISVNCAAIPKDLLESELFGYEQGAFTGASKMGKPGKFELAHKGTIFLDEIGDMPLYLQAKLLRVLQDKTFERVGGIFQQSIDVRIISATNKNLESMVSEGNFREDLYYRLNVIPVNLPSLKERGREDILLLLDFFLDKYTMAFNTSKKRLSPKALEVLSSYCWPGNVRELENMVQFLVSVSTSEIIDVDLIPDKVLNKKCDRQTINQNKENNEIVPLERLEKQAILNALKVCGSTTEGKLRAASALGISKTTLYNKLAEYKAVNS